MNPFEEAVCFAVQKHSGQTRKLNQGPYILHPMEVASIVGTMTTDPDVLCAAVLHDTVEDTDASVEEIRERFGARVAELVTSETECKRRDLPGEQTWLLRKQESLAFLEQSGDMAVKMLWLGDKLSNLRSFYREYARSGSRFWEAFHQKDPAMHAWYYRSIARCLGELSAYPAYREYELLMNALFANSGQTEQGADSR